jgi:hypothetical protein
LFHIYHLFTPRTCHCRSKTASPSKDSHAPVGQAPGTPRGQVDSQTKTCMNSMHGYALAVAALLVAAAKLPLGVPSRLPLSAFWIAKRLVCTPHGHTEASRAVEREAGYVLLGALCSCLHGDVLRERNADVLQMLEVGMLACQAGLQACCWPAPLGVVHMKTWGDRGPC